MSCATIEIPSKGRVSSSEDVTVVDVKDYDDEWKHEAWLQKSNFQSFAGDVKMTIPIFRNLAGFAVDQKKYCLRGVESYLHSGQRQEEMSSRKAALEAVLIEAEDQFYFDVSDAKAIRMALDSASKKPLRLAHSRAVTDAMVAGVDNAPMLYPITQLTRPSSGMSRLQTQRESYFLMRRKKYSLLERELCL